MCGKLPLKKHMILRHDFFDNLALRYLLSYNVKVQTTQLLTHYINKNSLWKPTKFCDVRGHCKRHVSIAQETLNVTLRHARGR